MAIKAIILDGYTDEPAGLGVPPYIDVYPRYIAGAIWEEDSHATIKYYTIDNVRDNLEEFLNEANNSDYTIVIAGVVVPGKYLGGNPLTAEEAITIGRLLKNTFSILTGPAARFGMGLEGGRPAYPPSRFKNIYHAVVNGDPEVYIKEVIREGEEKAREWAKRRSYEEIENAILKGTKIVKQHPNHGYNLIAEIETYRGCSRWLTGGCSFCIEPLYGKPIQRRPDNILKEIIQLYNNRVKAFRLGRQADFLVYGSKEMGEKEFPKPNPELMESLLYNIRKNIENSLLHIDNVNPGTIARHKEASKKTLEAIVKYHTPGDVAALGLESADEKVIRENNLNTNPNEALDAIEIINKIGGNRGWNGLPELLPGINFIIGLPAETPETFRKNIEFLERVRNKGLLLRRINIRKVMPLPSTRLGNTWKPSVLKKHHIHISRFQWIVRHKYDVFFLKRIVPEKTVLRRVFIEKPGEPYSLGRQQGSYPLTIEVKGKFTPPCVLDVVVIGHKARSVKAVPLSECYNV